MSLLYLVRHGQTALNVDTPDYPGVQFRGWSGIGLTATGERQAAQAAAILQGRHCVGVVASNTVRTLQTARIIADALNLPMSQDRNLDTWDLGELEGKDESDPINAALLEQYQEVDRDAPLPGGSESFNEFLNRVEAVLQHYEQVAASIGDLILVTHGKILFCAAHVRSNRTLDIEDQGPPNGAVAVLRPGHPQYAVLSAPTSVAKADPVDTLLAIADQLEPAFRNAYLAAVQRLRASVSREGLARMLETGVPTDFWQAFLDTLDPALRDVVNRAVLSAASHAGQQMPESVQSQLRFDLGNPRVLTAVDQVVAPALNTITAANQRGLVAAIRRGLEDGVSPGTMARRLIWELGLTDRDVTAVENYLAGLVRGGTPAGRAADLAEQYANRLLRQRAQTIARTETIRAVNAGQQAAWLDARAQGLLRGDERKHWLVTPDDRACPRCEAVPDENADGRALDEPYQTDAGPLQGPPLHVACRCISVLKHS